MVDFSQAQVVDARGHLQTRCFPPKIYWPGMQLIGHGQEHLPQSHTLCKGNTIWAVHCSASMCSASQVDLWHVPRNKYCTRSASSCAPTCRQGASAGGWALQVTGAAD